MTDVSEIKAMRMGDQCQTLLRALVPLEFKASYQCVKMAYYFKRPDVFLEGFGRYFYDHSKKLESHAFRVSDYIRSRQVGMKFMPVKTISGPEFKVFTVIEALEVVMKMEEDLLRYLQKLFSEASKAGDAHLMNFVKKLTGKHFEYLNVFREIHTQCKRCTTPIGQHILDNYIKDK